MIEKIHKMHLLRLGGRIIILGISRPADNQLLQCLITSMQFCLWASWAGTLISCMARAISFKLIVVRIAPLGSISTAPKELCNNT